MAKDTSKTKAPKTASPIRRGKPIALLVGDIHLSDKAPAARRGEPDWFEAMARPLDELSRLQREHNVPVLIAGDLFDRWNVSPALINFAIEHMPRKCLAIPGQHDLPNHELDQVERSAFHTMLLAGRLSFAGGSSYFLSFDGHAPHAAVQEFPWRSDLHSAEFLQTDADGVMRIALCHRYIWQSKKNNPADGGKKTSVHAYAQKLKGFDVAVFGDNHIGFDAKVGDMTIYNCGSFMRRHSSEEKHNPSIGILYGDGSIERHYLETSHDHFSASKKTQKREKLEAEEFVAKLKELATPDQAADFFSYCDTAMKKGKLRKSVRKFVKKVLDNVRDRQTPQEGRVAQPATV